MVDIMLSNENMQYINMATKITKATIIDCFISDDKLVFIVEKGHLGIAIGKNAKNLKKLRSMFKKNIKFVEYDSDKEKFLKNLFKPYNVKNISFERSKDEPIAKITVDSSDKSKIIGKGGKNIEIIRSLAQRHHSIKDVQIK